MNKTCKLLTRVGLWAMLLGMISCLEETPLGVEAVFEHAIEGEYHTTPLTVSFDNRTTGADFYEWTFEDGKPARSTEKNPGSVLFTTPGEHRVALRAWNANEESVKEITIRVDPAVTIDFDCEVLVNDFAPADVQIRNFTEGAVSYEWAFENGTPAVSTLADPGIVRFGEGVHTVSLKVSNGSEEFATERTVTVKPPLFCDFSFEPIEIDEDMEAPLTGILKNRSQNSLSVVWSCDGGVIGDSEADETTIRFLAPGTYTLTLTADNWKEQKTVHKTVTIKENCGIHTFQGVRFGINQAKNSIGCMFSASSKRVLKADVLTSDDVGASVDFGFFAQNSSFGHCCLFSPDKARHYAFDDIPGASRTTIGRSEGNVLTADDFDRITEAANLGMYDFSADAADHYFTLDVLPVFSFFRTADGRRGVVMIKEKVQNGAESYTVADIKIEKRTDE